MQELIDKTYMIIRKAREAIDVAVPSVFTDYVETVQQEPKAVPPDIILIYRRALELSKTAGSLIAFREWWSATSRERVFRYTIDYGEFDSESYVTLASYDLSDVFGASFFVMIRGKFRISCTNCDPYTRFDINVDMQYSNCTNIRFALGSCVLKAAESCEVSFKLLRYVQYMCKTCTIAPNMLKIALAPYVFNPEIHIRGKYILEDFEYVVVQL